MKSSLCLFYVFLALVSNSYTLPLIYKRSEDYNAYHQKSLIHEQIPETEEKAVAKRGLGMADALNIASIASSAAMVGSGLSSAYSWWKNRKAEKAAKAAAAAPAAAAPATAQAAAPAAAPAAVEAAPAAAAPAQAAPAVAAPAAAAAKI